MRKSYKNLSISGLSERYGLSRAEAQAVWNRTYRQALRTTKGYNKSDDRLNISKELHNSLLYRGNQVFDIDMSSITPNARLHQGLSGTDLKRDFVALRFEAMADKYEDINLSLQKYTNGEITYEQFLEEVNKFKSTNKEYLTQEYRKGD